MVFHNLREQYRIQRKSHKSWISDRRSRFSVDGENFYVLKCQWASMCVCVFIHKTCYLRSTPIIIIILMCPPHHRCKHAMLEIERNWLLLLLMDWHEWIINVTLLTELAMRIYVEMMAKDECKKTENLSLGGNCRDSCCVRKELERKISKLKINH